MTRIIILLFATALSAHGQQRPDAADLILHNGGRWRPLMVNEKGEFVEGKFLGYMVDADRAGLQITVHAIGDEANNVLLNYLEELNKQNGKRDRRFRLVHAQVLAPGDFKRLGQGNY